MLMWTPGPGELIVLLVIVLLFFGKSRLPGLARSIGSGINEFKKGISGQHVEEDDEEEDVKVSKKKTRSSGKKS